MGVRLDQAHELCFFLALFQQENEMRLASLVLGLLLQAPIDLEYIVLKTALLHHGFLSGAA